MVPVRIPGRDGSDHEAVVVIVHSGGLAGIGEAPVVPGLGFSLAAIATELAAVDGEPVSGPAKFGLETARLDLAARSAGVPVAELIGGARRRAVRCAAVIRGRRPAEVAAEVEAARARGFVTCEVMSSGHPEADLERVGAARYAAGPDLALRIDLGGRLALDEAIAFLPDLQRFRLELIEQPLPAAAPLADWLALESKAWAPLYADESLGDPGLAVELGAAGIGFAVKLATVGGWEGLSRLASRFPAGQFLLGSASETSIGVAAALHAACAFPRAVADSALAPGPFEADLGQGLGSAGPRLELPAGPGLGVELDREALRRYRVDR